MDVLRDFAGPFAARTLRLLLGLHAARDEDLEFASQAFIDGTGNYGDDPDTWQRCERANRLVDEAITADWDRAEDGTVLRALIDAGTLSEEEVRANIKLFTSGGLNEPRDVIATTLHALLADREQEALAREDPENLAKATEESLRWTSPIGMFPRVVHEETELGGVQPVGRDPDRRPHRLRQPRRAPLGGPGPLRPAPGDRPSPRVLAWAARLPRRVRRAPAGHARRAARAAGATRHPPRHHRRSLPGVGLPRPSAARRHVALRVTGTAMRIRRAQRAGGC